jgi:hypothetical protein
MIIISSSFMLVAGGNYSSIGQINPDLAAGVAAVSLLFLAYIVYKVWRSLRDDRKTKRSKKQEEAAAFRDLYKDNFGDEQAEVDLFQKDLGHEPLRSLFSFWRRGNK